MWQVTEPPGNKGVGTGVGKGVKEGWYRRGEGGERVHRKRNNAGEGPEAGFWFWFCFITGTRARLHYGTPKEAARPRGNKRLLEGKPANTTYL